MNKNQRQAVPRVGATADRPPAAWSRFVIPSGGIPAWLLSLSLHAALLLVLGLAVRVSYRGAALEVGRAGGIVLARESDGEAEYFGESDQALAERQPRAPAPSALQDSLPTAERLPVDLAGALPQQAAGADGPDFSSQLPSATGLTRGARPSGGRVGGNQARTGVFGVEGTGTKFVYVFDRSASMAGYDGRPLAAAKGELIASVNDLDSIHQFQIIFYNDRPMVFNPNRPRPPRMLYGDEPTRHLAKNFVRAIVAAGSTQHIDALKLALNMQPDVIFFLTDAAEPQLSASQLNEIRILNARIGASINAIEFGPGPRRGITNFLIRLAQQNGGDYAYVDVTRLPSVR